RPRVVGQSAFSIPAWGLSPRRTSGLTHGIHLAEPTAALVYNRPRILLKTMHLSLLLTAVIGGEIVDLVNETGFVAKGVLGILLLFSIISWAIILSKWSLLRRARVRSGRFIRAFPEAPRLQVGSAGAEQFLSSPLVGIFEGGLEAFGRQVGNSTGGT